MLWPTRMRRLGGPNAGSHLLFRLSLPRKAKPLIPEVHAYWRVTRTSSGLGGYLPSMAKKRLLRLFMGIELGSYHSLYSVRMN